MNTIKILFVFKKLAKNTTSKKEFRNHIEEIKREAPIEWIEAFIRETSDCKNIPDSQNKRKAIRELIAHLESADKEIPYETALAIATSRNGANICERRGWWDESNKPIGRAFTQIPSLKKKIDILDEAVYFRNEWFEKRSSRPERDRSSRIWMLFSLLEEELESTESSASKVLVLIDGLREFLSENRSLAANSEQKTTSTQNTDFEFLCCTRPVWQALVEILVCTLEKEKFL